MREDFFRGEKIIMHTTRKASILCAATYYTLALGHCNEDHKGLIINIIIDYEDLKCFFQKPRVLAIRPRAKSGLKFTVNRSVFFFFFFFISVYLFFFLHSTLFFIIYWILLFVVTCKKRHLSRKFYFFLFFIFCWIFMYMRVKNSKIKQ